MGEGGVRLGGSIPPPPPKRKPGLPIHTPVSRIIQKAFHDIYDIQLYVVALSVQVMYLDSDAQKWPNAGAGGSPRSPLDPPCPLG